MRATLLVLLLASSAFLYDTAEAWTPGQNVLGPPFLLTFLTVPWAVLGVVSGALRLRVRRAATAAPYVAAVCQAGLAIVYSALVALVGGEWFDYGHGSAYVAETYLLSAAILATFWWAEDWFVSRRRNAGATAP